MAGEKIIDGVSSKENVSDKHEWVKEQVKTELNDLKMDVLGFYEPDSANPEKIKYNLEAVKQYLGELCKSVEGKSDKEAWQYLKEKASRSYAWIMAVQIALESLGEGWDTDVNKIDGLLGGAGSHTRTAVRKFQDKWNENHKDKLNPDGLPGRSTIKALLEAMGGSVSTKVETDKDKIEKVLLYEEVPVVKGEEITVDKLIKENPGGVEVKIAEGQDLSIGEVGEKTVTVELKSGEETDKKEVKVKVVEQTEIDKYKLDRVVLHEEVSIVKGEEITVDKLIKENLGGVEVKIAEGQDLSTGEVGEKTVVVELKSGEKTDKKEVKVKVVEQTEIDKYKLDRVVLHEEVPVVKGEEITVDKLIKENPGGVEVKIAEGQDLSTAEVGEKTVTVELKSGEETDKKEVKVNIEEKKEDLTKFNPKVFNILKNDFKEVLNELNLSVYQMANGNGGENPKLGVCLKTKELYGGGQKQKGEWVNLHNFVTEDGILDRDKLKVAIRNMNDEYDKQVKLENQEKEDAAKFLGDIKNTTYSFPDLFGDAKENMYYKAFFEEFPNGKVKIRSSTIFQGDRLKIELDKGRPNWPDWLRGHEIEKEALKGEDGKYSIEAFKREMKKIVDKIVEENFA